MSLNVLKGRESSAVTKPSQMSGMDRRILHRIIHSQSNELMEEFVSLHLDVQRYLIGINCEIHMLLTCIMDIKHVRLVSKVSSLVELQKAASVSSVFLELINQGLISFLQFSIVKRVIQKLCVQSVQLQQQLQQYEDHFKQYIMRRVCDSSIYHEGRFEKFTGSDSKKMVELLIITDDNWDDYTPFVRVLDLEKIVAKCLDFNQFNLHLVSIEPHCLRLHYVISVHIAHSVFPLTTEEWKYLTSYGIIELKCEEFHYVSEQKGIIIHEIIRHVEFL